MPIEKVKGGYRWGKNGKIYPTREEAEKQAEAAYANGYTGDKLALDTVNVKMRRFDRDNRLHVEKTPISKAIINGYFGREIVGSQELGLEPEKEYKLLRDPEELKKAAPTFNNIPLLNTHIPVNAEKPHKEYVVGSTGSDGDFNDPYLNNSLVIWDGEAIDKVESGSKKELSAAYHYRADMTPGYYNGEYYDGVMRDIVGNHVALVEAGRAGADVYVSDEKPKEGKFIMSKMLEALRPHLSKDADLEKIEELIRQNTELDNERHNKIENKEEELLKGQQQIEKQHKNLSSDTEKEHKEIAKNEPGKKDGELKKTAKDTDNDNDDKEAEKKVEQAMDSATVRKLINDEFKQIRIAESAVRPLVGEIVAMDSATEVYRFALKSAGISTDNIHPSAFPTIVEMLKKEKATQKQSNVNVAMDSNSINSFSTAFPNVTKLKRA